MYWPLQRQGATGETVRTIQYLLNANGASLTVDGDFGPLTEAAVTAFQNNLGLVADGIVGDATWAALVVELSQGNSGDAVRAVQSQLNSRSPQVTVSGTFDAETQRAVEFLQYPVGLASDGIVNWYTWQAVVMDYLRIQDPAACMDAVFHAWSNGDQATAALSATAASLSALFGHPRTPSENWIFDRCGFAAGHIYCTWNRVGGGSLVIGGPDPGGGLYVFADSVTFQ